MNKTIKYKRETSREAREIASNFPLTYRSLKLVLIVGVTGFIPWDFLGFEIGPTRYEWMSVIDVSYDVCTDNLDQILV